MNKLTEHNPLLWAGLFSFVLSLCLSFNAVLNIDGILYLRAAREFAQGHNAEGLALYAWPFYSLLIVGFSKLTTLSLDLSATLINAGLMALMAGGFVALVREMGASKTVQWVAAFVFLIHPGMNYFRDYVIRDFGSWAMLLWSLVFLCQYSQKPSWKSALGWTLAALIGVLFRPEGILWLLMGPLALMFSMTSLPLSDRCLSFLKINSLFIVMGLSAVALFFSLNIELPVNKLEKMIHGNVQLITSGLNIYAEKARAFSQLMSVYFEYDDALIVLGFALLFYGSFLLIKLLSPLYLVFLGYAIVKRPLINKPEARILLWMLLLYSGLFILFLAKMYFMDARYMVPWVSVAMIWVPFALVKIWANAPKALKATIGLIFLYMLIDSVIDFGYSKMYLKEAGVWIKQNTPAQTELYTNSRHIAYYADRPLVEEKDAEVIALRYSRKTTQTHQKIDALSAYPQEDFHNKRDDGVRVIMLRDKLRSS